MEALTYRHGIPSDLVNNNGSVGGTIEYYDFFTKIGTPIMKKHEEACRQAVKKKMHLALNVNRLRARYCRAQCRGFTFGTAGWCVGYAGPWVTLLRGNGLCEGTL
jgi:hypothetical protein